MFQSTERSQIAISLAVLLSLAVAGGAFAYWSLGILQGTFETFAEAARQHFGS